MFKKITVYQYECCRCGHGWNPRKGAVPVRCAGCKTPYWNVPKPGAKTEVTEEFEEIL